MAVALPSNSNIPILPRDVMGYIMKFIEKPRDIIALMQVSKSTKAIAEPLLPSRLTIPDHYSRVRALTKKVNADRENQELATDLAHLKDCYKSRCTAMKMWYDNFGGKAAFLALPVLDTTDQTIEFMYPDRIRVKLTEMIMRGSYFGRQFVGFVAKVENSNPPRFARQIYFEREYDGSWSISQEETIIYCTGYYLLKGIASDGEQVTAKIKNLIKTGRARGMFQGAGASYILSKPEARPQAPQQ